MPVALTLNDYQMDVVNAALKGKNINVKINRNTVNLTSENWEEIRNAVQDLHNKKFKIRTKTAEHLETCYYAEQVLERIGFAAVEFRPATEDNDNTIGLVIDNTGDETPEEDTDNADAD